VLSHVIAALSPQRFRENLAWYNSQSDNELAHFTLKSVDEHIRDEVVCAYLILRADIAVGHATYMNGGGVGQIESRLGAIPSHAMGL
jgi:hypothetical protein